VLSLCLSVCAWRCLDFHSVGWMAWFLGRNLPATGHCWALEDGHLHIPVVQFWSTRLGVQVSLPVCDSCPLCRPRSAARVRPAVTARLAHSGEARIRMV